MNHEELKPSQLKLRTECPSIYTEGFDNFMKKIGVNIRQTDLGLSLDIISQID